MGTVCSKKFLKFVCLFLDIIMNNEELIDFSILCVF